MSSVGEIWADAGLHVDSASFAQYGSMINAAEGDISKFSAVTNSALMAALSAPAAILAGVAGYGAIIGASYETASIKLETLYGTQQRAREEFQWLSDFAASTPFEFPELLEVDGLLKNAGLSAQDYIKTVGDASSANGKSIQQTTEAVIDAMTNEYERLKEYGITSVDIASTNYEQFGLTVEDVGKRALFAIDKNGQQQVMVVDKNNKQMIASTILAFWNEKYAGAMEKQSQSIQGLYSTVKDNIKNGLAELAGFDMSDSVNGMKIETFSLLGALKELAGVAVIVTSAFANMSEPMQTFVIVASAGVAAVGLLAAGFIGYTMAAGLYASVTGIMITETLTLGAAISAAIWPATLVVGALALVAAGLVYLDEKTGIVSYSFRLLHDLFTITFDGMMTAASILKNYIVEKMEAIKEAIVGMFPDGFLENVGRILDGITSDFSSMGANIHNDAEEIRNDNTNIGTSTQDAGNQVGTATGGMQTDYANTGLASLTMGGQVGTASGQMITGMNNAGSSANGLTGNINGVVPAVNALSGASYTGVTANQAYAASFVNVSNMANAAASAAISSVNRIGAAIKTNISQVGQLEALAGKWNTTAKLGVTSSGGSGTGEENVKVVDKTGQYAAPVTRSGGSGTGESNVKINTVNNYGTSTSTTKVKSVS